MRVLICGSRHWTDYAYIEEVMKERLSEGDVVIHGGARGADNTAGEVAEEMGLEVLVFKAEWKKYSRAAGPIRNQRMLNEGKPDEVWAFTPDLAKSKGTRNMVTQAKEAGVPTEVFTYDVG